MKSFHLGMIGALFTSLIIAGCRELPTSASQGSTWLPRDFTVLGGKRATVLGAPRLTDDPRLPFVQFDGKSDGLVFPINPIAGQRAFSIEVRFKPDRHGPAEQRFVHVEDVKQNRALIETRITQDGRWYLDTFLYANREPGLTLVDKTKLHPCDRWYWAALVFDGKTMRHYVNGIKELEGRIDFGPMAEGRTSIGVRLNQVFWYQGEIAEVRFLPLALDEASLQKK